MHDITSVAALLADPSRSRMLTALMDGRALTATELALEAGIVPSTASSHLARLAEEGLVAIAKQGRHRYFRIATADAAALIESLMRFAARDGRSAVRTGPRDEALRRARVCYDHLAGELGVELLARMRERRLIRESSGRLVLTKAGEQWLRSLGVDLEALRKSRRPLCRPCLDWSERRTHLAGAVGGALLERLLAMRLIRRQPDSRALTVVGQGPLLIVG